MPHISQPIAPNILLRSTGLRPKRSAGENWSLRSRKVTLSMSGEEVLRNVRSEDVAVSIRSDKIGEKELGENCG